MNRITAVLLAMIGLLVHALIVHRDAAGSFAPAFESAHVAYVLGRNLAETGEAFWWSADGATVGSLASYPSPLLVWTAAALELLSTNVERAAQVVGLLCALATVFLSTRFDTDRIAGVIPALLLVASGAVAAAGASGSEWPIAMFALAASFVALEHGRNRIAAIALVLLATARPEGLFAAAALLVMTVMRGIRGPAPLERRPVPKPWVFVPSALAVVAAEAAGATLLEDARRILVLDPGATAYGAQQALDFTIATVSPLLLIFPVVALVRGGLSAVGARALVLTVIWTLTVIAAGGGPAAFDLAFAPALPVAFIAIQQGMARALDTYRKSMERLVWVSLSVVLVGSLFASRFPGDFGRFPVERVQERLYEAHAAPPLGRATLVGRAALYSEARLVSRLRRIGAFLGSRLAPETTVLSPWPGVLQWRMDAHVLDAFDRVENGDAERPRGAWSPCTGAPDLEALLDQGPDLVLPAQNALEDYVEGRLEELLPTRLLELDAEDGDARREFVRTRLARYEIVVTPGAILPTVDPTDPLLFLRRRGTAPDLSIEADVRDDRVAFTARYTDSEARGVLLPQVVDTRIVAVLDDARRVMLDPRGGLSAGDEPSARGLVLDPVWDTPITIARLDPRAIEEAVGRTVLRIELRLLHHRVAAEDPRADAANPVSVDLR